MGYTTKFLGSDVKCDTLQDLKALIGASEFRRVGIGQVALGGGSGPKPEIESLIPRLRGLLAENHLSLLEGLRVGPLSENEVENALGVPDSDKRRGQLMLITKYFRSVGLDNPIHRSDADQRYSLLENYRETVGQLVEARIATLPANYRGL